MPLELVKIKTSHLVHKLIVASPSLLVTNCFSKWHGQHSMTFFGDRL